MMLENIYRTFGYIWSTIVTDFTKMYTFYKLCLFDDIFTNKNNEMKKQALYCFNPF